MMKYCLLTLLALVVCSGQSCLQPLDRLAVNDELRTVCEGYPDSQILGRIEFAENDRLSNSTKADCLKNRFCGCSTDVNCNCWVAVIDQVYDNAP